MYIRRKVFSTVIDENGEEKYFSTNEIINEEDYLDEVMYSDLEEREFASKRNLKKLIKTVNEVSSEGDRTLTPQLSKVLAGKKARKTARKILSAKEGNFVQVADSIPKKLVERYTGLGPKYGADQASREAAAIKLLNGAHTLKKATGNPQYGLQLPSYESRQRNLRRFIDATK